MNLVVYFIFKCLRSKMQIELNVRINSWTEGSAIHATDEKVTNFKIFIILTKWAKCWKIKARSIQEKNIISKLQFQFRLKNRIWHRWTSNAKKFNDKVTNNKNAAYLFPANRNRYKLFLSGILTNGTFDPAQVFESPSVNSWSTFFGTSDTPWNNST